MSAELQRSQSMEAYVGTFGEPDPETAARLWARVETFTQDHARERRHRRRVVALATVAVVALALAVVWWQGRGPARATASVMEAGAEAERIVAADGREITLRPGARIRIDRDSETELEAELLAGEIDVGTSSQPSRVLIRAGAYTVHAAGDGFRVRHTGDVPLVTVFEGGAQLTGPSLPPDGIRILGTK